MWGNKIGNTTLFKVACGISTTITTFQQILFESSREGLCSHPIRDWCQTNESSTRHGAQLYQLEKKCGHEESVVLLETSTHLHERFWFVLIYFFITFFIYIEFL